MTNPVHIETRYGEINWLYLSQVPEHWRRDQNSDPLSRAWDLILRVRSADGTRPDLETMLEVEMRHLENGVFFFGDHKKGGSWSVKSGWLEREE